MHRTSVTNHRDRPTAPEKEGGGGREDNISARTISQSVSLKMTVQQWRKGRRKKRMRQLLIVVEREKHDEIRGGRMDACPSSGQDKA